MKLSVIIVNYKTPDHLKSCINSIHKHAPDVDDIIVIDNDSQDDSVDMLRKNYPEVRIIASKTNGGYAMGVNWGINYAKHETVILLNPDVKVQEGSLQRLYGVLRNNDDIGIVAPKLMNTDGTLQYSCLENYHIMTPFYRRTSLGKLPWAKKDVERFLMKDWDHNSQKDIPWAIGAALMIKRELLDKIGLMDDRFFMYYEDVDLCRRFWEAGYRVVYVHDAVMGHVHERASAKHTGLRTFFSFLTRVHIKSWLKYLWKYKGRLKVVTEVDPARHG